jgi:hypothetical protein
MTRINADALVGEPGQRIYSASRSKGVTKALRFEDGIIEDPDDGAIHNTHYHSAYVEGFILGTVAEISERSQGGKIPKKWANLVERNPKSSGYSPAEGLWSRHAVDDFWRALVGDLSYTANNPPRCYRLILEQAYSGKADVDLEKLIFWGDCEPAKDVSRRIHAVIWNRRMMRVKREQNSDRKIDKILGLAPDSAKEGDLVCILYGCSVPVILRCFEKSQNVVDSQKRQQEIKARLKIHGWLQTCFYRRKLEKMIKSLQATSAKPQKIGGKSDDAVSGAVAAQWMPVQQTEPPFDDQGVWGRDNDTPQESEIVPPFTPLQSPKRNIADTPRRRRITSPVPPFRVPTPPVQETPRADAKVFYKLIGECYVHRMMNGEAVDYQSVEKLPKAIFEIR